MQIDRTTYRSPNHDQRPAGISAIVIHTTEGRWPSDAQWLCSPKSGVSTHYAIDPLGHIYQLVPDSRRAWHAGISALAGQSDVNDFSLGIELSHQGSAPYPPAQLDALACLVQDRAAHYTIPASRVVSHRACALPKGRKGDPGGVPLAPEAVFRAWVNRTLNPAPPPYTQDSPTLGTPRTNADSVIAAIQLAHARRRNQPDRPQPRYPDVTSLLLIVGQYFEVCQPAGLNTDLVIAQMLHETDWLCSDWCDRPRRNPAGLGVNGVTQKDQPADTDGWALLPDGLWYMGLSFANWYASVPAHVGRYAAYATRPIDRTPAQQDLVATALASRPLPSTYHGCAPTLRGFEGRWAVPGPLYADAIAKIANTLGERP